MVASRISSHSPSSSRGSRASQSLPSTTGWKAASGGASRRPDSMSFLRACWRAAALKNMARIIGAGPLMVIETEVVGVAEVEAGVEPLDVLDGADRDPGLADLAPDVGARVGVLAVEGDRVEGGGEAVGGLAVGRGGGSARWCARGRPRRRTSGSAARRCA